MVAVPTTINITKPTNQSIPYYFSVDVGLPTAVLPIIFVLLGYNLRVLRKPFKCRRQKSPPDQPLPRVLLDIELATREATIEIPMKKKLCETQYDDFDCDFDAYRFTGNKPLELRIASVAMGMSTGNICPVVGVCVNGNQTLGLLDSGSNVTLLTQRFVDRWVTGKSSHTKDDPTKEPPLADVAGREVPTTGQKRIAITFCGLDCRLESKEITATVMPRGLYEIVIGCDVLKQFKAIYIDWESKTVTLGKPKFFWWKSPFRPLC